MSQMTSFDTRLYLLIRETTWLCDSFGKLVYNMYPQCLDQIGQYLKYATSWKSKIVL